MVHALHSNGANSIWEHTLLDPTNSRSGRKKPQARDPVKYSVYNLCSVYFILKIIQILGRQNRILSERSIRCWDLFIGVAATLLLTTTTITTPMQNKVPPAHAQRVYLFLVGGKNYSWQLHEGHDGEIDGLLNKLLTLLSINSTSCS